MLVVVSIFLVYGYTDEAKKPLETITGKVIEEPQEKVVEDIDETTPDAEIETQEEETSETVHVPEQHHINVFGTEGFNPKELTIFNGDNVSWKNEDIKDMVILIYEGDNIYIHSKTVKPGETFTYKINKSGFFDVYWNTAKSSVASNLTVKDTKLQKIGKKDYIEKRKKEYGLNHLIEDLNEILGFDYKYKKDAKDPQFHVSNDELKYYLIHTIDDKNKHNENAKEFCGDYCAEYWDGWKFYVNMSAYRALVPSLDRNDFIHEAEYYEYITDRVLIDSRIIENSFDVENGKVLEYQYILWKVHEFGRFEGAWEDTLLTYKIYCSPNMTVLIRPRWEQLRVNFPSASVDDTFETWNSHIIPLREELLEKADKILERCPVEKEFFSDFNFPSYSKRESVSYFWRTHYKDFLNITRTVDLIIEPSNTRKGDLVLKGIKLSLTNGVYHIYDLGVKIDLSPDNKSFRGYLNKGLIDKFLPGHSITRTFKSKSITFTDNIKMNITLYENVRGGEIRPFNFTFTNGDLIKSKTFT